MSDTSSPTSRTRTPQEIEAEIARTRAELRLTVDELSERLDPRTQAHHVLDEAKVAADDLRRRLSGETRGATDPEPTRTGWIALGAAAAAATAVVAGIIRKL